MKKLSFLAMAAGLLLAGCSSDSDLASGGSDSGLFNGKTEGYFKINLNLPTAPVVSTRAWQESTNLNDGLAKEYGVKSLILLLFDGPNEAEASLKQVVNLTSPSITEVTPVTPDQVTTKTEFVAKLNSAPTNNLYALAVVNGKGNIEIGSDETKVKIHGGAEQSGIKLADLQSALSESSTVKANDFIYDDGGTDYYFMTNAVLSNEKGGTVEPTTAAGNLHTLAPVDKNFIYETEAKATAGNAATDIYVERGMAKVTIASASLGTTALTDKTGKLNASLDGWCLDITNKSSYIVRQVPTGSFWNLCSFSSGVTSDKYRFIGGNSVDVEYGTAIAGYRTYWAMDPNYSGDLTFDGNNQNTTNFSYATYASDKSTAIGDENPQYCFENTFDVAHQDARYTTRALVGVKLTSDASDFYVLGADRKTLYTEANVKNQVLTDLNNISIFSEWYATAGGGATLGASDITVEWDKTTAGKILVTKITVDHNKISTGAYSSTDLEITSSSTTVDGKNFSGVIATLNTMLVNVERFKGGIAYYPIRIKHFGDDLTPWNVVGAASEYLTAPKESGIDDIYPNDARRDANYLGRYGMVRNNWYELVIGDLVKIGYSEPPTIPSHPDDDLEDQYIKARINILSWAKRTQNWNLK